ncbi:MAG: hypothetical protein QM661_02680 [Solimonas sp.]
MSASVFIGARTCGVELQGAALIEAMGCAEVLPYLRAHLQGGDDVGGPHGTTARAHADGAASQ